MVDIDDIMDLQDMEGIVRIVVFGWMDQGIVNGYVIHG